MTQLQISSLLLLNTAMLAVLVIIAFRLSQGYNIFVKQGANHTPAPVTVDTVEIKIPREELNSQRKFLLESGYTISRAFSQGKFITLTMTKIIDGTATRQQWKDYRK